MYAIRAIDFLENQNLVDSVTLDTDSTAEYSSGGTYSVGNKVKATTTGGTNAAVATYKIYEAIQSGAQAADPTQDVGTVSPGFGSYWKEIGSVNEWAWANGVIADTTVKTSGNLYFKFIPGQIVDAICLSGLVGESVNITMTSAADGVVHNVDYDLVSYVNINSFYECLFEPLEYVKKISVWDLPAYSDATIEITISVSSGNSEVGSIFVGRELYIGKSLWGSSFGYDDYTRIEYVPELNRTIIEERNYSEESRSMIWLPDYRLESVRESLPTLRAKTTAWINKKDNPGTLTIGILREMTTTLREPNGTFVDVEVGGAV
ncbi:MAG: hypothetical protein RKH07_12730 [Gammaproteobacteria bacterium]